MCQIWQQYDIVVVVNTCTFSHYSDVIMGAIASLITNLTTVYSTVYSDADQRKHQSHASLAFVWGIHRGPMNSPHKWPVTRKMFPFDDVIIYTIIAIFKSFKLYYVRHSAHQQKTYRYLFQWTARVTRQHGQRNSGYYSPSCRLKLVVTWCEKLWM